MYRATFVHKLMFPGKFVHIIHKRLKIVQRHNIQTKINVFLYNFITYNDFLEPKLEALRYENDELICVSGRCNKLDPV